MAYIGCSEPYTRLRMKQPSELNWIKGLRAGYKSLGATQKDQYSWLARTKDSCVFTAEIDHVDPARNSFDAVVGAFHKKVPPLSVEAGDHSLRVRHAQELLDAVREALDEGTENRLLLLRGTRYSNKKGVIYAAVDPGFWSVRTVSGDVNNGFEFTLVRISHCKATPHDT